MRPAPSIVGKRRLSWGLCPRDGSVFGVHLPGVGTRHTDPGEEREGEEVLDTCWEVDPRGTHHAHAHTPAGPHRQNPCSTAASCTRKSHRHSGSSSPPAPAWLPESQREIWIFFFMSYSSEPIYFMVQLDGLLPGLLQKVHPLSSPKGGAGVVLPSRSPLAQESKCWARGWGWEGGVHPSAGGAAGPFVFCKPVPRREATDTHRKPWVGVLREEHWAPSPPEGNDNHHREKRKESQKTKENQLNLPHCE